MSKAASVATAAADASRPLVSVVMPVFNAADFLEEAIASVLAQSHSNLELVTVDDGSADDSAKILQAWARRDRRIRLLQRPHEGLGRTRNAALSLADGKFIAAADADDVSAPDRLEVQLEYLRTHPRCVAVGGQALLIDREGDVIGPMHFARDHEAIDAELLAGRGLALPQPATMYRRSALDAVGGYRDDLSACKTLGEDLDLSLKLAEVGLLANLPETVLKFRKHALSTSALVSPPDMDRVKRALVQEALNRRGISDRKVRLHRFWQPESLEQLWTTWALLALRNGRLKTAWKYGRLVTSHEGGWKAVLEIVGCRMIPLLTRRITGLSDPASFDLQPRV